MAELKKYTHDVFKQKDLIEYLTNEQAKHYMEISYAIMQGRMAAGKNPENHYLVCNTDEPYADQVRKVILDGEDEKAGVKPKCGMKKEWDGPVPNAKELRKLVEKDSLGLLVEVVRCKDCKHGSQDEDYYTVGGEVRCTHHEIIMGLEGYCSDGGRR